MPAGTGVRLCVCADDFGLHEGINEAVCQLVESGRVQAVGAMAGAPAWKGGAAALLGLRASGVDVGLHLDFTEHPLRDGSRHQLPALIRQAGLGRLDRRAVRAEIRAQLDAFEAAFGKGPAFVDGHQHVHQLPLVRDEVLAELRQRYPGHRPWIRRCQGLRGARRTGGAAFAKAAVIGLLGARGMAEEARRSGFGQNRGLLGVYDFAGGRERYLGLLRQWLGAARDGDLLMCHPGLAMPEVDALSAARQAEYEVLASVAFAALLRECRVSLSPLSRLLDHRA